MAFPFWWMGAAVAALFLTAAFMLFGAALRMLDWTIGEARQSVLPGVVSGFRGWVEPPGHRDAPASPSPTGSNGTAEIQDIAGPGLPTARARRR